MAGKNDNSDLLENEGDFLEVLRLLDKQPNLSIPKEQAESLKFATVSTFEQALADWNDAIAEEDNRNQTEEDREILDLLNERNILKAEKGRSACLNKTVASAFHFMILLNFLICFFESYLIIVEKAKLDYMFLQQMFQCNIPQNQDHVYHFINIFYALSCVVVLHAKTKKTAHLCWAFLVGCILHFSHRIYGIIFHVRFEYDQRLRGNFEATIILMFLNTLILHIPSVLIILLRYYDLTEKFEARAHEFATKTYAGRQLNDKMIYKNVSSFLQRKFVLRSCTSLQIFNTVNKILAQKRKLKKGQALSEEVVEREVMAAVAAFKEVEHLHGMEMLRELKRRQYEDQYENDGVLFYDDEEIKKPDKDHGEDEDSMFDTFEQRKSDDLEELFDVD